MFTLKYKKIFIASLLAMSTFPTSNIFAAPLAYYDANADETDHVLSLLYVDSVSTVRKEFASFVQWTGQRITNPQIQVRILYEVLGEYPKDLFIGEYTVTG